MATALATTALAPAVARAQEANLAPSAQAAPATQTTESTSVTAPAAPPPSAIPDRRPAGPDDTRPEPSPVVAPASPPSTTASTRPAAPDYYRKSRGYRVEPEPDPPAYVRNLSKTQFERFKDVTWLDVGLDFRTRYEFRENDLRRRQDPNTNASLGVYRDKPDNLVLLRTRAYLGIHDILDPFRAALEFEDSRSYNGRYEKLDSDVNEAELIQAYVEYYGKDAIGPGQPVSLRVGRQAFEQLDRRFIATNQFRNTTNNFDGVRLRLGKKQNAWDFDTFALNPVRRYQYRLDRADRETLFYGGILSLKQYSDIVTVQPYFLGRRVDGNPFAPVVASRTNNQDIRAPGVRAYGLIGKTGFDFDLNANYQYGHRGATKTVDGQRVEVMERHRAQAYSVESGYTFKHPWQPRASLYYGYGSGDKDPNDNASQRLDTFYGFNQPWSRNDYYSWDNISTPKARIEFRPNANFRVDAGYGAFWLASKTDSWNRANLRDRNGNSGSFMGQEIDFRFQYKQNPYVDWSASYARYFPGGFTRRQDRSQSASGPYSNQASNFFYLELSLNAFRA